MCPAAPCQPSPALLECAVRSGPVSQRSTVLSHGSVWTGVSRAGAADIASSAPAREEKLEEGLETLPSPLSYPGWRGSDTAGRNGGEAWDF